MCGIAGLIGWRGDDDKISGIISKMQNSLHHRGPDSNGVCFSKIDRVYFAHTRLSILDLSSAGKQPMISSCGRFIITYNGEIYNHLELRKLLKSIKPNIKWIGSSDTETLVESFSILGINKTLMHVRGMFALALFDKKYKKIHLIRDRYGEKPLYYLNLKNGSFAFASEISSFEHIPEFSPSLDLNAAACFFQRGYVGAPLSIWQNVKKVMPGTKTIISLGENRKYYLLNEENYWSAKEVALQGQKSLYRGSYEDGKTDLEKILLEVLHGQSLSDVPLGVFLSGGIDSSIVAALMQKISSKKIKTFSVGFSEQMYDESSHAEAVARHLNTDHITLHANPSDAIDLIEEMPNIYSEPFADSSQIPTTLLSKLVRNYVTVALSGDGGDEIFSGYTRYIFVYKSFNLLTKAPYFLRSSFASFVKTFSPELINKFGQIIRVKRLGDKAYKASDIMISEDLEDYYNKLTTYWPNKSLLSTDNLIKYQFSQDLGNIENMMLADQLNYLPNDILVKVDRAAMSESLETRAPLLDHVLSEFAWSTPLEWRLDKQGGKKILRDVLYKYVPKTLIDRPKQGFGMPVNEWLRGPLKDWALNLFDKQSLPNDGLIQGDIARKTLDEHLKNKRNWDFRLWPILMWQQWKHSKGLL